MRGALRLLVSGGGVTTGTCGEAKRVNRALSHCAKTAAPMMARCAGAGDASVSSPTCTAEAVAVAAAEPGSAATSSGG